MIIAGLEEEDGDGDDNDEGKKKMEDGVWFNWCSNRERGFPKSPEREVAPGDKK